MADEHKRSYDYFDAIVLVGDEGEVSVSFFRVDAHETVLSMSWDELRDVVDFASVHGLGMSKVLRDADWRTHDGCDRAY